MKDANFGCRLSSVAGVAVNLGCWIVGFFVLLSWPVAVICYLFYS